MPYEPNLPDGYHLGNSRKNPGESSGNMYDQDGNTGGPASWIKLPGSPDEETGHQIDIESAVVGAVVGIGVLAAGTGLFVVGRRVYQWWKNRKSRGAHDAKDAIDDVNEIEDLPVQLTEPGLDRTKDTNDERIESREEKEHSEKFKEQNLLMQEVKKLIDTESELPAPRELESQDDEDCEAENQTLKHSQ